MKLSTFGESLTAESGIVSLMEDLGEALNVNPEMLFLGGGNPAVVPAFELRCEKLLSRLSMDENSRRRLLGIYQSPQGNEAFIEALARYFREQHQWPVTAANIAITNGSQSAFFLLLNMLSGRTPGGRQQRICMPMMPEYLGYRDQTIEPQAFVGYRPRIELHGEHQFKYCVDFEALSISEDVGAFCVSRPTNPTGNVLTDAEMQQLQVLSVEHDIPLIVDCAYGLPFPGIVYTSASLRWQPNQIFVLSLSKLGLPGVRTGIVVADEDTIKQLVRANTINCLANGNLGPMLGAELLASANLDEVCRTEILPYYQQKRQLMLALLEQHLSGFNYRVHLSEGAFFVWLWLPDLAITSQQLYQRLKQNNVLVMAGEHFFFGLKGDWAHSRQCLRLNFCQSEEVMSRALEVLAHTLRECM